MCLNDSVRLLIVIYWVLNRHRLSPGRSRMILTNKNNTSIAFYKLTMTYRFRTAFNTAISY